MSRDEKLLSRVVFALSMVDSALKNNRVQGTPVAVELVTAATALRETKLLLQPQADVVPFPHPGYSVRVPDWPINRGTPAHDLDGYSLDDPKRGTL